MKPFSLRFDTLILRFYLMMAIIIISFFVGLPWLALLSLPVFYAALAGIDFFPKEIENMHITTKKLGYEKNQAA